MLHLFITSLQTDSDMFLLITCRKGGALPDGVSGFGEKLVFQRPIRSSDSGAYECEVQNEAGVGKTEYIVDVAGRYSNIFLH